MSQPTRVPAFCTQCRSRCGCVAVASGGRLQSIEPLPGHPSGAQLCPKGRAAPELVHHPRRLTTPLRRSRPKGNPNPGWRPVSWDDALDETASRMRHIAQEHGPEQTAFSVTTPSGTHIGDSIQWVERLIRAYGSPNNIYSTEICNWHKDHASRLTYGHAIGTPDFANTDCMLLWGNNPAATWLAMATEVNRARRRGAKLLVVDPRPTVLARRADVWLQVRPGTDQALALGLANLMLEDRGYDESFLRTWTNAPLLVREDSGAFLTQRDLRPGGDPRILQAVGEDDGRLTGYDSEAGVWLEPERAVRLNASARISVAGREETCHSAFALYAETAAAWTPDRVQQITGVPTDELQRAAALLAAAPRVAYYAWNGTGQGITASQTDRAVSLLYTLTGSYGREGGNVPGSAAAFTDISGWDLITPAQAGRALGLEDRPLGPPSQGWVTGQDVYRAILDGTPYPVRMLVSFGGNLLSAQPDTDLARRALNALEFHVHADFFENAAARHADLLLPVATSWEREGLRAGFDSSLEGLRRVQLRPAVVPPVGESRSDIDIVLGLGERLGLAAGLFDLDVDRGHDEMLRPAGLDVAALREIPEGIDIPSRIALEAHARVDANGVAEGFPTPTRRIEVFSQRMAEHGYAPLPTLSADALPAASEDFPLLLSCAKSPIYCHGQHRNIASLRRREPDPPLHMCAGDAASRGLDDGDWARITTSAGSAVARVKIVNELMPGTVFGQHGWWDAGPADGPYADGEAMPANLNRVMDTSVRDPISGSIALRCQRCEVQRLQSPPAGPAPS